ncbi:MAG: hypothetical protein IT461_13990, partial [Planctomycetes bacterium]|nr:hypothetical protein [Planctomycetota bacterium]
GTQGATVIASDAVTSAKILNGTISGADLNGGINISTTGTITASSFSGDGSALTGVTVTAANVTGTYNDLQVNGDTSNFTVFDSTTWVGGLTTKGRYTGTVTSITGIAGMATSIGCDTESQVLNPTATVLAMATVGVAQSTQAGVNVGLIGGADNSTLQNFGVVGIAGPDTDFITYSDALGTASAAILGINTLSGAGEYGLLISATNNRIEGNLTLTGTVSGNGSALNLLNHGEVRATIEVISASSVTVTAGNTFIRVTDNGAAGSYTGTTLPTTFVAGDAGKMIVVSNEDTNSTVDVNTSFSIPSGMTRTFVWDGTNWR